MRPLLTETETDITDIIPSVGGLWPGGYDHTRDSTIILQDTGIKAYRPYKVPDLNETAITMTHIEASKTLEDQRSATGLAQQRENLCLSRAEERRRIYLRKMKHTLLLSPT